MNIGDVVNGMRVDQLVHLPAFENLVLGYFLDASVESNNHNIFRLDKGGNVIWQIARDENGILNWEALHRHARERGEDGARWPFENLSIIYADGSHNHSPQTGTPPPVDIWVPGCRILSTSAQGYGYEIDIQRGIARNMADGPQRPW